MQHSEKKYERAAWLWAFGKACESGDREAAGALIERAKLGSGSLAKEEKELANAALEWCARRGWIPEGGSCVELGADQGLLALRRLFDHLDCVPGFPGVIDASAWEKAGNFCAAMKSWGLAFDAERVAQEASRWLQVGADAASWGKMLALGADFEALVWKGHERSRPWTRELGDLSLVGACLAMGRKGSSQPWALGEKKGGSAKDLVDRLSLLKAAGASLEKASQTEGGAWMGAFATAACHGGPLALSTEALDALEALGADPLAKTPWGATPCGLLGEMRRFEADSKMTRVGPEESAQALEHARRVAGWFAKRGEDFDALQRRCLPSEGPVEECSMLFSALDSRQWEWARALRELGADPRRGLLVDGKPEMDCFELLTSFTALGERCPLPARALLAMFEASELSLVSSGASSSPKARL
jgi:hypothetical protein